MEVVKLAKNWRIFVIRQSFLTAKVFTIWYYKSNDYIM